MNNANFKPEDIYPDATRAINSGVPKAESNQLNDHKAKSALQMGGVYKAPKKSRSVDYAGWLIILSGVLSLIASYNHLNIGSIFDAVAIIVGFGILARSALAKKIVVFVLGLDVLFNILTLFSLAFFNSRRPLYSALITLISLIIEFIILSILTQLNVESEFS